MRQELLEFELKIKEIELQYGTKIDELELKRRSNVRTNRYDRNQVI